MSNKALVVIDIQNDITKHYMDIINWILSLLTNLTSPAIH